MTNRTKQVRIKPDVLKNIRKAIEGANDAEKVEELWNKSAYRINMWLGKPINKRK